MKRNTLTTAVLAGLTGIAGMASVANAVNVNPDGLGQVLLFPYYSARGGNDTLISIVNTAERGKAVKVRFIEALNSREVLDFNLYMSPFDVWTASITATDGGGAKMVTRDTSCTVPYFVGDSEDGVGEQEFLDFEYTGARTNFDGGPQGIERTASGYIEVIEMAEMAVGEGGSYDPNEDGITPGIVEWASKHVNGVPRACSLLERFWTQNDPVALWLQSANFGFTSGTGEEATFNGATGGLYGSGSIINVADGTMFSYNATAIDGFWAAGTGSHTNPGSVLPGLNSGTNAESFVFDNGALENNQWDSTTPVLALNAALTLDQVLNEYVTDADINARTEWVMTFPTRRFHVDALGKGLIDPGDDAIPPFTRTWFYTVDDGAVDRRFFACEDMSISFWDREEQTEGIDVGPPIVSPPPPEQAPDLFQLCAEANVIRFASDDSLPDATEILGEPLRESPFRSLGYTNFELPFDSGWARFELGAIPSNSGVFEDNDGVRRSVSSTDGRQVFGLPVVGFGVTTYTNGDAGAGVLANYGGTYQHRGTRAFVDSGADRPE
ncbi:hypothetical protein [Wenzhouxiangella limi]|uniref:Cell surface protein n=1 Tax=Wenzhouxiangella limi TaxID=2707351 RepID=A0A845UWU6_9GAMM|nr:hypothetical protein [Wenzhouxiangella limi]NDY94974.1 hypothetical protein [Wenzhouxiangella limi]